MVSVGFSRFFTYQRLDLFLQTLGGHYNNFIVRTLHMYEPAMTVTGQYGSSELGEATYQAAFGKLFTDSLSWKNEVLWGKI